MAEWDACRALVSCSSSTWGRTHRGTDFPESFEAGLALGSSVRQTKLHQPFQEPGTCGNVKSNPGVTQHRSVCPSVLPEEPPTFFSFLFFPLKALNLPPYRLRNEGSGEKKEAKSLLLCFWGLLSQVTQYLWPDRGIGVSGDPKRRTWLGGTQGGDGDSSEVELSEIRSW